MHAISDGRSVSGHIESLANATDKDTIKAKIDEEVTSAKEAGLNFNVLCNIWLCKWREVDWVGRRTKRIPIPSNGSLFEFSPLQPSNMLSSLQL